MVRMALDGSPAFDGLAHLNIDLKSPFFFDIEFKEFMGLHQELDVAP